MARKNLVATNDVAVEERGGAKRMPSGWSRWWIYQRERFPIFAHGMLIAAFSFCMVAYSALARGYVHIPDPKAIIVAFGTAFICFLQLRIADEFKDFAEDSRYRPYRPVPRGLVTLRELGIVAVAGGVVQLLLALWLSPTLLPFLLALWLYLGLMTREFFVSSWLKAHPITYMWTHMLIIPLIDLYGTACDWLGAHTGAPASLVFLLCVSFCNGFAVEIGRKIRAPQDEETGVETYSYLWGRKTAVLAWLGVLVATACFAVLTAGAIHFTLPVMILFGLLLLLAALVAASFLRKPLSGRGKLIEHFSGIWTLLVYLSLGALPLLWLLSQKGWH